MAILRPLNAGEEHNERRSFRAFEDKSGAKLKALQYLPLMISICKLVFVGNKVNPSRMADDQELGTGRAGFFLIADTASGNGFKLFVGKFDAFALAAF